MPDSLNLNEQTGLADVLQICCLSRRSGQIAFQSEESSGFLYLQHGRVIHAVCGDLDGEAAVYRMLGWPPGHFSLNEDILPQGKTITASWEHLLLEGARHADEKAMQKARVRTGPVSTIAPLTTSSKTRESLPKITINFPNERPRVVELEAEYTHVGRASGNEIPLVHPSVSNRHCIFILNGSEVIVRDLNSSNGTTVNGSAISEVVLHSGDLIQAGIVQMRFEQAIRRPKLTQNLSSFGDGSELRESLGRTSSVSTVKLPFGSATGFAPEEIKDDSAFVKGQSPISYDNLAKPEVTSAGHPLIIILGAVTLILAILGGCYYYFFLSAH